VQLALFPECYLQGYASDRQSIDRRAIALDSDAFRVVLAALAPFRSDIVIGLIERRGAALYNTAVVIRRGRVLGAYAKTHTNEPGFNRGEEYPVFETAGWPFGINICYDANFPDAALKLSRQGARLLCYPLNNLLPPDVAVTWRDKSLQNLRQRAMDTGCWVVSSDVIGEHERKISHGCTCVVQPDGQVVRRAFEGSEDILVCDLALTAKMDSNHEAT
jgi:predicted amidohydrolase